MRQRSDGFDGAADWGRWRDRDHDRPREGDSGGEPVFTTLAVGEEGDPDPHPDPVLCPEPEPVFTTLAVGEEGDPDPGPVPIGPPEATTLAIGEEGDPDPIGWPGPPEATTLAVGEEGDPWLDSWGT